MQRLLSWNAKSQLYHPNFSLRKAVCSTSKQTGTRERTA